MSIFTEIEGMKGENLSSALLQYLMNNSAEIRDSIILLLSNNSPIGPFDYRSHYSCQTEYSTADINLGNGRLDILLQLDNVVIGIENKFFADFQDNQPDKYISSVKEVANALSTINHTEVTPLLYVFCPASRENESRKKIEKIPNSAIVTWEKILDCCKKTVEKISNPDAKVLNNEFIKYLEKQFSFIDDYKRKYPHILKTFPPRGTPLQVDLIGRLWSLMPAIGSSSGGESWRGYYFYAEPQIQQSAWVGFVKSSVHIKNGSSHNESELVVVSTYKPSLSDDFCEVEFIGNNNFCGHHGKTEYTWIVKFDESWNKVDIWREKLAPFWGYPTDDIEAS